MAFGLPYFRVKKEEDKKPRVANADKIEAARKEQGKSIGCPATVRHSMTGQIVRCSLTQGHIGDHIFTFGNGVITQPEGTTGAMTYTFSFHVNQV